MRQRWWIVGLAVALLVAMLSPLASPHPDGLERVAEDAGFIQHAQDPWYKLIPDYLLPGIDNEAVATILAGLAGTGLAFLLILGLGRVATKRRPTA